MFSSVNVPLSVLQLWPMQYYLWENKWGAASQLYVLLPDIYPNIIPTLKYYTNKHLGN